MTLDELKIKEANEILQGLPSDYSSVRDALYRMWDSALKALGEPIEFDEKASKIQAKHHANTFGDQDNPEGWDAYVTGQRVQFDRDKERIALAEKNEEHYKYKWGDECAKNATLEARLAESERKLKVSCACSNALEARIKELEAKLADWEQECRNEQ